MIPYLIAGAIGFGIGKLFEQGGETFMAGGMTNEDILRSFLTSERETQTNNLATFYSTLGAVMLLRNYGTLIAKRNGRRVEITNVKHSKTTSAITNRLKALAEEMGYNVSYVSEFENGGVTDEVPLWSIRDYNDILVASYLDEKKLIAWAFQLAKENGENVKINSVQQAITYIEKRDKNDEQDFEVYENYADGGEAGSFSYDYYEVYDESTGKSLMIYAIDQEDAESIAEELDFESFEDGDEYNPNEDEYEEGGQAGKKPRKKTTKKKQPKMVRQYFEDRPYSYAKGGSVKGIKKKAEKLLEDSISFRFKSTDMGSGWLFKLESPLNRSVFNLLDEQLYIDEFSPDDMGIEDYDDLSKEEQDYYYEDWKQELFQSSFEAFKEKNMKHLDDFIEYIQKAKEYQDEMNEYAGGGRIDKMDKFISELAKKNTKKFSVNEYHDFRNKQFGIGVARHYFTDNDGSFSKFDTKLGDTLNIDFETQGDSNEYPKGGSVSKGYNVFNYTDDIYATDEVFKTKKLANDFIKEFRSRFSKQGYYRDNQMNKIDVKDIDLLAIPSDFNPFGKAI